MRTLIATLKAAMEAAVLEPKIRLTLSDPAEVADDVVIEEDRILRIPSQEETTDSHVTEVICDNADGYFTLLDLKGWDAVLERGLVTAIGARYSAIAPLKVLSQYLSSAPGVLQCRLSLIGIPNLLAEDKASKDYFHHWSDTKTVKAMITEIADGEPVSTELTEEQAEVDGYIDLDDTLHGAGQRRYISETVTTLSFRLKKTGAPSGNVTFRIRATDDDEMLGSKVLGNATALTTEPAWYEVTFDAPVVVDEEVWLYCEFVDGTDVKYVQVSYSSVAVKPEEWLTKIDPVDGPVEFTDLDCAYRYKYTATGIDCWERGTSPETYCKSYEVVYDPYGTHTGGVHATIMTDSAAAFKTDALIGQVIYNVTDGSSGIITDNDATTVTVASLAGGGDNQWDTADVYTIEDPLLDVYMPKDAFRIYEGQSRLDTINRLLGYTGCVKIVKADGKIHIFVPVTSGEVYDSEYSLAEGSHTFFSKAVREALIIPSRIVVKSLKTDEDQYSGAATSAVSFALLPITGAPIRTKLVDGDQAISIAKAMIARLEMAAQRGAASVPMNLGSEVYDYVKVTDSRQGDSRVGNLGYIRRSYDGRSQDAKEACPMNFSFGRVRIKSVPGTRPSLLPEAMAVPEPTLEEAILRWGMIKPILEIIEQNFDDVWGVEGGESIETLGEDASIAGLWRKLIEIYTALGWFEGETPTDTQILLALLNYYTKAQVDAKGYLKNLIEDLTPQLGGNLDTNSKTINIPAGEVLWFVYVGIGMVMSIAETYIRMQLPLDMNSEKITELGAPADDADAATKKYVDDNIGGGLENIVEDLTPQLGGNLECNGKSIRDTVNGIVLTAGNALLQLTGGGHLIQIDADGNLDVNTGKVIGLVAGVASGEAARYDELETVDGKVDTVDAKLDDVSVSDVQGSRAGDTVYRNTSGKIRIVTCGFRWSTGGNRGDVEARIGAASPPTTHCCQDSGEQGSGEYGSLTFVVPNNYYYAVYYTGDTPDTVENWVEYDLH